MLKRSFIFAMFALAVLGCKKKVESPPPEQTQPEPRTLRIYRDGVFKDSINVAGWEVNEDVLRLRAFYYPWQGEDSINYITYNIHKGFIDSLGWEYLMVNGEVVGVNLMYVDIPRVPDASKILTVVAYLDSLSINELKNFPNLVGIDIGIGDAEKESLKLLLIPSRFRLYLDCYRVTDCGCWILSRFNNIRALEMWNAHEALTNKGLKYITKLKELRVLIAGYPQIDSEGVSYIESLRKLRVVVLDAGCI